MEIPGYQNIELFHKDEEGDDYLATQKSTGRQVIVRFLSKKMLPDSGSLGAYLEDGQAARSISHPNIARIHEVGNSGDNLYLVREYVPGVSLDVKYPEMGLLDKIYVVKQVAKTLDYIHSKGCGHFNLKLSNIIICERDSRVILVGFELPSKQAIKRSAKKLSATSATFMSPEQIQGNPPDIRSDMYSLGIIFYNLLADTPPYRADTPDETASKHLDSDIPRLNKALSIFQDVVDTAMAKSPENRFQSGSEMTLVLDMLDDEDIIKAELQASKDIRRIPSDDSDRSGNDKKDNVVILPTPLSMQAMQSGQPVVERRKTPISNPQNADATTQDSLEKLNQRQTRSEKITQKTKIPNKKQVNETRKKSDSSKKPIKVDIKPEKPKTTSEGESAKNFRKSSKNQATSHELAEIQRVKVEQLQAESASSKELSEEHATPRINTKMPWLRIVLLALMFLGALLYLDQQKILDIPVIKPLSSEATSAWKKLSEFTEISYQRLKAKRTEAAAARQNQNNQPNKSGERPIKPALQAEDLQSVKTEMAPATISGEPLTNHPFLLQNADVSEQTSGPKINSQQPAISEFTMSTRSLDQPKIPPKQADIDWLLQQAAIKYSAGNLLQPADDNAVIFYRQVLAMDEGNQIAIDGLGDIRAEVIEQITYKIDNGQLMSADALLTRMNIFFKSGAPYKKLREQLDQLQIQKAASQ